MSQHSNQNQFLNAIASRRGSAMEACACGTISKLYISRAELIKTYYGINFANYCGYQLNVELTINWSQMGFATWPAIDRAFRDFMQCMHKHVKCYKKHIHVEVPFFQYSVFENGLFVGAHSHSGIHVPREMFPRFYCWLEDRISELNTAGAKNVFDCKPPRLDPTTSQWKWFAYAMKGLDPSLTVDEILRDFDRRGRTANYLFGVNQEYGGYVPFRRVRRSHAMSERRQIDADYVESVCHSDGSSNARYSDAEYQRGRRDRLMAEVTRKMSGMEPI
jgi:hypothetical protein